ncbi:MAG: phosphate signaling complex protein PhoU, partial [Halobacteriovoraceae bacterium]|nr:phosphate signaling complex protein PhoU [Halobacteriovoraceae bacterium]
ELAREILNMDDQIDYKEVEIEEECLKILALYQPVAIDLRFLIGVLKMNNDLERIGDLCVNIARRSMFLAKRPPTTPPFDLATMAEKSTLMLHRAIDSLINMNADLARQVCADDQEIDKLNRGMYQKVYEAIKKNPDHVEELIQYLSASRYLERIADYTTNIAEDVIYMVDGSIVRHGLDSSMNS